MQGVAYRYHAAQEAARLGVVGWVRNEADGAVAAHVQGEPDAVGEMASWCRTGSPSARVDAVIVDDVEPERHTSFEVRS